MDEKLLAHAEAARGFMPLDEGIALHDAALDAVAAVPDAPVVEVGTYCGRSTLFLAAAAREAGNVVVTVDHHRGSEENQPGWEWHEPDRGDPELGVMDTLSRWGSTPAAMVFIDGGHGVEPARADYRCWNPMVAEGGLLAIHDVFPDPADGGRPPYEEIYLPAIESGRFAEVSAVGSLRILRARRAE